MNSSTAGKIYTPIFSFFRKRVANIVFLELGSVSNERSGNSTFYRGIHNFLNSSIIEKITVFLNSMLWLTFHRKFCEMATTA